jgi:hypothetical protein
MPADYQKIRAANIARYGWDTAVLDLLGHLYSERTHFIFELIQNAEDAGATELSFTLHDDRLEVRHDGRPFTAADVEAICGVARSDKDLTKIGQFGIGFKAVYAYTSEPRIYSGDEAFRIENYVRPFAVEPLDEPGTLFVFPLDNARSAAAEIRAALRALKPETLLFLKNITKLDAAGHEVRRDHNDRWFLFQRPVGERMVEIAFRTAPDTGAIVPVTTSPLTVFLPTEKETFLGFLVQGPYRTTPARDNVGEHDPANQALVRETAALLADSLRQLRDEGLLTATALATLPVDPARFPPGSFFRPLFDAARDALRTERLIPWEHGYALARDAHLAADPTLRELFGGGHPYRFVSGDLTPALLAYLRDEVGIAEVTAADAIEAATAEFLQDRPDEWLTRYYAFLRADPARIELARRMPVIRLEDGRHVVPFDAAGRPAVFLPRPGSRFPVVRRAIADSPAAQPLLAALGIVAPDIVDEALQVVLADHDPATHDADLELVVRAMDEAPAGRRQELLERLRAAAFLIGENAASGEQSLRAPGELYQRSRELEVYFGGNPDAWFAADRYGPWLTRLREMGVRSAVAVTAREPGAFGHVLLADGFARHERGLDGFDPDASVDGLEFALANPSHARSEYVWNMVLAPNRRLVAGVVEKSVRDGFVDATRETVRSALAVAAAGAAWLPGPDGVFRRPGELALDDLPPGYTRDDELAKALGMGRPVVAEAARQLGIPAAVLWGLSARPDLVAKLERDLAR